MKKMFAPWLIILMITSCFMFSKLNAQGESENTSPFSVNMDFVSRYLWRGSDFGNAPQLQPTLSFTMEGLSLGAWGSYSILGNYQEADLFASYSTPFGLSFTASDYYFPIGDMDSSYFSKGHYLEGMIGYSSGGLSLSANIMLATPGNTNDFYAEIGYTIKNLSLFLGAGNEAYTSDGKFMVCNVGAKITKEIQVSDSFNIPVFGSIILNPEKEQINLVIGFNF